MNGVEWNDRFKVGVEAIDKAHQKLFSIVGKLLQLSEDIERQQHACQEGIKYLNNYAIKHFAEEEAYMRFIDYGGYEVHKGLHDNMRDKILPSFAKELERECYSEASIRHFLGICIGWLNEHIMIEDHAIMGKTARKWVHRPSEDVAASLEKAIVDAARDLFRIDAQIISEFYSGEDFAGGKALCYRLRYLNEEKKGRQVFLVYEVNLILHILSTMIGKEVKRVDKTVAYTMEILSKQFMERISTHFTLDGGSKLERTDILAFEQLIRTFEKEFPSYSLLFGTGGKGYFAFCVR